MIDKTTVTDSPNLCVLKILTGPLRRKKMPHNRVHTAGCIATLHCHHLAVCDMSHKMVESQSLSIWLHILIGSDPTKCNKVGVRTEHLEVLRWRLFNPEIKMRVVCCFFALWFSSSIPGPWSYFTIYGISQIAKIPHGKRAAGHRQKKNSKALAAMKYPWTPYP